MSADVEEGLRQSREEFETVEADPDLVDARAGERLHTAHREILRAHGAKLVAQGNYVGHEIVLVGDRIAAEQVHPAVDYVVHANGVVVVVLAQHFGIIDVVGAARVRQGHGGQRGERLRIDAGCGDHAPGEQAARRVGRARIVHRYWRRAEIPGALERGRNGDRGRRDSGLAQAQAFPGAEEE